MNKTENSRAKLRDEIIKTGVDNNYSVQSINNVLGKRGLGTYNPLTSKYAWSKILTNFPKDAGDFERGALTFGGSVVKPPMDIIDAFASAPYGSKIKTASDVARAYAKDPTIRNIAKGALAGGLAGRFLGPIGTTGGAILGGTIGGVGGPKQFANAMLSTYNTDYDTLRSGKADIRDIIQGAQQHPVFAGLDFLSAGGGKLIGGVSKNVANNISKSSPEFIRQLLPDEQLRNFNRSLSTNLGNAKADIGKNYNAFGVLEGAVRLDRPEVARHIMTGKSNLKGKQLSIANAVRDSLKTNEKLGVDLGLLDPNLSKADTVAQYVMQYVPKSYNLLHSDYRDIILGNKLRPTAEKIIKDNNLKDTINSLIKNGKDLYDKDSIVLLTQKFAHETDPLGEVIARERNAGRNNYFDVTREIGRASTENLGKFLDDSVRFQLDQISNAAEFDKILDNILTDTRIVKALKPEDISNIKAKALKEISRDISRGEKPNLTGALARSGIKNVFIDPIYYKSLNNLFSRPMNAGLRRVLSQFKKNVLATPHWFALNRIGNFTNNLIEGVNPKDYFDTRKYKDYIPDQLKQQTSFSSYLNEGIENASEAGSVIKRGAGSTWGRPYNRIKNALNKYKNSNKSLEDITDLGSSLYANVNDFVADPIFRMESSFELIDRYANFIRQAKRYAKDNNLNVVDVLKKADADNKLFHNLNTKVNKSLGDYIGRQYSLPSGLHNVLSELAPFYKFYAQTLRTTAHQLASNPYKFQAVVQAPTKIGNVQREDIERRFNLNPEWYQGGVPYGIAGDSLRTMGTEPLPIQSVLGLAKEPWEGTVSLLNPVISTIAPAVYFQRFGKTATTPRLDELKAQGKEKDFKPTLLERLGYLGNAALGTTSGLYNMAQRIIPEITAPFTGGVRTKYDTNPFTEIPTSYNKKLPSETIFKQLGVKTNANYKDNSKKKVSKSAKRKEKRAGKFQKQKEIKAKKPLQRVYK